MRNYANFNSREISQSTSNLISKSALIKSKAQSALEHIRKHLLNALSGNSEVQIQQVHDRSGKAYWKVYDPATGYYNSLSSETEVRIWLEQRYFL